MLSAPWPGREAVSQPRQAEELLLLLLRLGFFFQVLEHFGLIGTQILDDLEVFLADLVEVDLLNVHQAQQRLHWAGNIAATFVAGAATLCDADLGPELGLVQAELAADFANIDVFNSFHVWVPVNAMQKIEIFLDLRARIESSDIRETFACIRHSGVTRYIGTTSRRLFLFLRCILHGDFFASQVLRRGGLLLVYNFSYRQLKYRSISRQHTTMSCLLRSPVLKNCVSEAMQLQSPAERPKSILTVGAWRIQLK